MSFGLRGVGFQLGFKNGPRKVKIIPKGPAFSFLNYCQFPSQDWVAGQACPVLLSILTTRPREGPRALVWVCEARPGVRGGDVTVRP